MFTVSKRIEIAGAHQLTLPYESKCSQLHGHNWIITVVVQSKRLNSFGMVIDFTVISNIVKQYDHVNINKVVASEKFNPTAENIALRIASEINAELDNTGDHQNLYAGVHSVSVQESEGNVAEWRQDS